MAKTRLSKQHKKKLFSYVHRNIQSKEEIRAVGSSAFDLSCRAGERAAGVFPAADTVVPAKYGCAQEFTRLYLYSADGCLTGYAVHLRLPHNFEGATIPVLRIPLSGDHSPLFKGGKDDFLIAGFKESELRIEEKNKADARPRASFVEVVTQCRTAEGLSDIRPQAEGIPELNMPPSISEAVDVVKEALSKQAA
jgi:hypothetical protein